MLNFFIRLFFQQKQSRSTGKVEVKIKETVCFWNFHCEANV